MSCLEEVPGHITPEIRDRMEEIETIRDSEIATPGDVKNANEILQAYQESPQHQTRQGHLLVQWKAEDLLR